ncbi:polysaccharide pyruvyl transferase family protein [Croceibacter atlanticus]|uniref:polysaccharide pyruvyl transferase family protein n=1 Tax=Croceibacter atlanticus TaxID=313588 RepID=UPI00248FDE54|nr:polysaccharide pyruvyl transferase family protein [Croceibacter atlanticus]
MKILIIGHCSLHWGRMEFGNIGNFYIMEPFVRLLHETFPGSTIQTTFQMSDRFCEAENINCVPLELYYNWDNDAAKANKELEIARKYLKGETANETTDYIELVKETDLVIDFSGDIWGDNADFLGDDRFFVGLVKDRVAQVFAKKTVMIAGSPGPFDDDKNLEFAKEVFANFDLVTNREYISKGLLEGYGFDTTKTHSLTCPAFRFEPAPLSAISQFDKVDNIISKERPSIGFLICGWNFTVGPFDKWPRPDTDYQVFVDVLEKISNEIDADIYLMSHSNGFPIPPKKFELIHGRDYPIMKQLQNILEKRGKAKNIHMLDEIYDAWQTKAILGQFDMVASGRVHAAVGAMSQNVPTVVIDYGHEPKAHKLKGFAEVAGLLEYVAQPDMEHDLYDKMTEVWSKRKDIRNKLEIQIPKVKSLAKKNFDLLKTLF